MVNDPILLSRGLVFLEFQRVQSGSQTKAVYYLVLPLLVPSSQNQSVYRGKSPNSTHTFLPLLVLHSQEISLSQPVTPIPVAPVLKLTFL